MARVSVIIPAYNRRDFIAEALESVREQTYQPVECIVVDDGSTDGTQPYLENFDAEWVIPILREQNHGASNARNIGLDTATGEYVTFLDSDDLLYPHAIKQLVATLNNCPASCAGVVGETQTITRNGRVVASGASASIIQEPTLENARAIGGPSGTLFERRVLTEVGGFDESLSAREDLDLYLRVLKEYDLCRTDSVCCVRRLHESQKSTDRYQVQDGIKEITDKHPNIFNT